MAMMMNPGAQMTQAERQAKLRELLIQYSLMQTSPGAAATRLNEPTEVSCRRASAQDLVMWIAGYPGAGQRMIQAAEAHHSEATLISYLLANPATAIDPMSADFAALIEPLVTGGLLPNTALEDLRTSHQTKISPAAKAGLMMVNAAMVSRAKRIS